MHTTLGEGAGSAVARTLRRCPLFTGTRAADLDRIAALTTRKRLDKGEYLFHEGMPVRGFFIVKAGAVKVHRVNPVGKEQVIRIFRPIESFAEEALMSHQGYLADACATEPTEVLVIQRAGFLAMVEGQPELALRLLRSLNRHVQILVGLLDDLTLKDVKTRLANWLIQQCPDPGSREPFRIQLPTTKRVLAAELGTVSETLSRTVAKFRALNLLAIEGNTVTLLCPERLTRLFGQSTSASGSQAGPLWGASRSPA